MINYKKGDALKAKGDNHIYIPHVCNNRNGWGSGFVVAISNKWSKPEEAYHADANLGNKHTHCLGDIRSVQVEDNVSVVNMIAQDGYGDHFKIPCKSGHKITYLPPVRYTSLKKCMLKTAFLVRMNNGEIHAPKFGAGLSGGNWEEIEALIEECWCQYEIPVTVYEYDG